MKTNQSAFIILLFAALIWGVTLPLMKVNLDQLPPLTLAFLRFTIASIIALIFSELKGLKVRDFFHIGFYAFFGITLNVSLLLLGLGKTSAIDATIVIALSPVIISALALFTLREKISHIHLIGIFLAFCGSLIYLVVPEILSGKKFNGNLFGDLLVFSAVISSGIFVIGSKKLFSTYQPSSIACVSFLVGMISFFPGAIYEYFINPTWVDKVTSFNLISVLFLGIFSSFIAYSAFEFGLSKLAVHVNATIGYLTPLLSVLIATVFLSERLHFLTFLLSVTLISTGIYLVSRFKPPSHIFNHHFHKV